MTTRTDIQIEPEMTMEEILSIAPAAQRALFQRYHVGGCSACGFQPEDTLAQVAKDHNILDMNDVIQTIVRAETMDRERQLDPDEVRSLLGEHVGEVTFLDVRTPDEAGAGEGTLAAAEGSEPLDYDASDKYMSLPKDRRIVFVCTNGDRSLDVASYFLGHGFTNVYAVRGGLTAWHA